MDTKKVKKVEVFEEWRKGWATPDFYVLIDRRKKNTPDNRTYLRTHKVGEVPFVKFRNIR